MTHAVARMVGVEDILDGVVTENEAGLAAIDVNGVLITACSTASSGTPVTLYMRPEDITIYEKDDIRSSARNKFTGRITEVIPIGPMVRLKVDVGVKLTAVVTQRSFEELGLALEKDTELTFKASAIHVVERKKV
jgi:molybdopterin-binding protein